MTQRKSKARPRRSVRPRSRSPSLEKPTVPSFRHKEHRELEKVHSLPITGHRDSCGHGSVTRDTRRTLRTCSTRATAKNVQKNPMKNLNLTSQKKGKKCYSKVLSQNGENETDFTSNKAFADLRNSLIHAKRFPASVITN